MAHRATTIVEALTSSGEPFRIRAGLALRDGFLSPVPWFYSSSIWPSGPDSRWGCIYTVATEFENFGSEPAAVELLSGRLREEMPSNDLYTIDFYTQVVTTIGFVASTDTYPRAPTGDPNERILFGFRSVDPESTLAFRTWACPHDLKPADVETQALFEEAVTDEDNVTTDSQYGKVIEVEVTGGGVDVEAKLRLR